MPFRIVFATLFFSVFITVTGVGIVVPLLPVYANSLGASGFYISLIFGSFSISRTLLLPWCGRKSDETGRKPFIVWGLFAYFVVSFAFLLAPNVEILILARFFHGMASAMVMPVANAYIGELTRKGSEGTTMGLFNMSMFASLSLGPLLGGVIQTRFGLHTAFIAMGGLAFLGFLASLVFLPETKREPPRIVSRGDSLWKSVLRDPVLASLLFFRFAYTCCVGVIWCFLPVLASTRFAIDAEGIGFLVTTGVFVSGVLNGPMGWLSDRASRPAMILVGGLLVGIGMFLVEPATGIRGLVMAVGIFGVGGGISVPAVMAMAVDMGREGEMGSIMALMTMAHSLGMLVGSLGAGVAMDGFSLGAAFPLSGGFMLASLLPVGVQLVGRRPART